MLDAVLEEFKVEDVKEIRLWSDCGRHFRSYEFLAWATVLTVRAFKCPVVLSYYGEHHGKGRVDGWFGLLDSWLTFAACRTEVLDLASLVRVLTAGASDAMLADPAPRGAQYDIREYVLPRKDKVAFRLHQSKLDLKIDNTYCVRGSIREGHPQPADNAMQYVSDVNIHNYVYSDRLGLPDRLGVPRGGTLLTNTYLERCPVPEGVLPQDRISYWFCKHNVCTTLRNDKG
jgi:hypothetical protein